MQDMYCSAVIYKRIPLLSGVSVRVKDIALTAPEMLSGALHIEHNIGPSGYMCSWIGILSQIIELWFAGFNMISMQRMCL